VATATHNATTVNIYEDPSLITANTQAKNATTDNTIKRDLGLSIAEHISTGIHILEQLAKTQNTKVDDPLAKKILEDINMYMPRWQSLPHHTPNHSSSSSTSWVRATNQDRDHKRTESDVKSVATNKKLFKTLRARGPPGTVELTYGSVSYFLESRLRPQQGLGVRCSYATPAWLANMMFSISIAVCLLPRPSFRFDVSYSAEVPWESDIFTFSQIGDFEGLVKVLREGRGSATDHDARGVTALHVSAHYPKFYGVLGVLKGMT